MIPAFFDAVLQQKEGVKKCCKKAVNLIGRGIWDAALIFFCVCGHAKFHNQIKSLFFSVVELEYRYAEDTMPRGVLGLNTPVFTD